MLSLSPVAYAGWSQDALELIKLAASGPAIWISLARVMITSGNHSFSRLEMVGQAVR